MTESIYGAAHRMHGVQRFTRWAFSKWLKFSMPIVKKMIEEQRAQESIYMRAYYISRQALINRFGQ